MPRSIWTSNGNSWQLRFPGETAEAALREFVADVERKCRQDHPDLRAMCDWAYRLGLDGLATLQTTRSDVWTTLKLIPQGEEVSFATVNHDATGPHTFLRLWRSVLERSAPESLGKIEAIAGHVGTGTEILEPSRAILSAVRGAFREASLRQREARTQRVTPSDVVRGEIRLPRSAKALFPATRGNVNVLFQGTSLNARYDPRTGSKERSARLSVGKATLAGVPPDSVLRVSRDRDGQLRLD